MSILASYKAKDRQIADIELVIPVWFKVCSLFVISFSRATLQQRNTTTFVFEKFLLLFYIRNVSGSNPDGNPSALTDVFSRFT
jgi:hypothetical protein